ncbi:hypothetical protein D3C86_1997530 [compost metagenome]
MEIHLLPGVRRGVGEVIAGMAVVKHKTVHAEEVKVVITGNTVSEVFEATINKC